MNRLVKVLTIVLVIALMLYPRQASSQALVLTVNPSTKHQVMEGFGASLAFYENWLTAHPRKAEIYQAVFGELGLDILRVRNAHGYDAGMVGRVSEFMQAAEKVRGKPIPLLSTSWGPPAYLKSNNDRKNGGTIKYSVTDGKVAFDYEGFANWWDASLNEYAARGIYPTWISIQNEPDYADTWETCRFHYFERVTTTDTLAGYNKALAAVHAKVSAREQTPAFLGPECIGLGYSSLRWYLQYADLSLLDAVAFHLYHGVNRNNPWAANDMAYAAGLAPSKPYFQTEFEGGGWFNTAGLIYQSLVLANVSAYFYWDLIWSNGGLVSLDNPWTPGSWSNPSGYTRTKNFFAFKHFSAFVYPGWQRVGTNIANSLVSTVAFMNPAGDSLSVMLINRSETSAFDIDLNTGGFSYNTSKVYQTTAEVDFDHAGALQDGKLTLPAQSITTVELVNSQHVAVPERLGLSAGGSKVFPNPFNTTTTITHTLSGNKPITLSVFDISGKLLRKELLPEPAVEGQLKLNRGSLKSGLYLYRIENHRGDFQTGRFVVTN
jgi:glucuronoarabinoxylan endo-1,4-beta-xylanase